MTTTTIHHEPYENDDNREQCLKCGQPIPGDQVYCEPCFERLESEGYFEVPEPFDAEDFND